MTQRGNSYIIPKIIVGGFLNIVFVGNIYIIAIIFISHKITIKYSPYFLFT